MRNCSHLASRERCMERLLGSKSIAVGHQSIHGALGLLCPAAGSPGKILAQIYGAQGQVHVPVYSFLPSSVSTREARVP